MAAGGSPLGDRQAEDAVRELARRRDVREVDRGRRAARAALQLLLRAHEVLGVAVSWSTWDTLGGGGMASSDMKHERLQEARGPLMEARDGMLRLSQVFDGLAVPDLELPQFGELMKELDVYWDNRLTDAMVHTEIVQLRNELDRAILQVREVAASLERRSVELLSGLNFGWRQGQL